MKTFNILMVGVGGQGIILSSDILTQTALNAGLDTKKSEIHGMSQRGGSVFSHVRFGDKVHSPVIADGEADIFISLEKMETLRWLSSAHKDTQIIVLEEQIKPAMVTDYPEGYKEEISAKSDKIIYLNPKEMTEKVGLRKFLNVTILGIVSRFTNFSLDNWKDAIMQLVPEGSGEENWKAFEIGRNYK